MAELNSENGSIVAHCPGCNSGKSTFEWKIAEKEIGAITNITRNTIYGRDPVNITYRLFKCAGCGRGALGIVLHSTSSKYPGSYSTLVDFHREAKERIIIPTNVPIGIRKEFREAEQCHANKCYRAAVGLFRSVLDKTMRANGYKFVGSLQEQIDKAALDGVITGARKKKAHDEIRVLGNDVLHDEWHEIPEENVVAAKHYCQRILEDFYDDRETTLGVLREKKRIANEDKDTVVAEAFIKLETLEDIIDATDWNEILHKLAVELNMKWKELEDIILSSALCELDIESQRYKLK